MFRDGPIGRVPELTVECHVDGNLSSHYFLDFTNDHYYGIPKGKAFRLELPSNRGSAIKAYNWMRIHPTITIFAIGGHLIQNPRSILIDLPAK